MAPIVRNSADGDRELVMARWGMPGTTAVWRPAGHRHPQCREPVLARLAIAEEPLSRARDQLLRIRRHQAPQTPTWFALSEDRTMFAFGGVWTRWRGVRWPKSGRRGHQNSTESTGATPSMPAGCLQHSKGRTVFLLVRSGKLMQ
jgi:putative SOS response-associated peptidase YedK